MYCKLTKKSISNYIPLNFVYVNKFYVYLCLLIKGFRIDRIIVTRPAPHPTTQSKEISKEEEEKEAFDGRSQE